MNFGHVLSGSIRHDHLAQTPTIYRTSYDPHKPRTFCPKSLPITATHLSWAATAVRTIIFGALKIDVQDSIENLWDSAHPFNQSIQALHRHFGFKGSFDLVLRSSNTVAEQRLILDSVKSIPGVTRVEDPYEVLAFASKDLSPPRREILEREFALTRPYERWFSNKEPLVRATIFVAQDDIRSLRPIRERLADICKGDRCFVTGDLMSFAVFSDHVIRTLIESFAVSLVLVIALLISLSRALAKPGIGVVIISSIWGPCVLLGLLPLVIGSVNFVTCLLQRF